MSYKLYSNNTLDPVENISFQTGYVTEVDYLNDTAIIDCGTIYQSVPIFYNCPSAGSEQSNGSLERSSSAFCKGDEVVVRFYKGSPSHIIGFKDELWPCIKTPALLFRSEIDDYFLDIDNSVFNKVGNSLFYDRYKELALTNDSVEITTYINQPDADISTGFVSYQIHWIDGKMNRYTQMYFNGELIYSTLNNETNWHVFNGTRSNILSLCVHPVTGWGSMIYQINTYYNWQPQESGRVEFDFYLYTSTGTHIKLASAEVNVTGEYSQATGLALSDQIVLSGTDEQIGNISLGNIDISEAGVFSADSSTNYIGTADNISKVILKTSEGANTPIDQLITIDTNSNGGPLLTDGTPTDFNNEIYIKKR
ncbi:MAG: hypothetical protein C0603_05615 [Denitrovibrio sp.]|nr:MAG: hypothetical protein C0603_05615 [Denitrovibrio sp.]